MFKPTLTLILTICALNAGGCGTLTGAHYDIETVEGCMVRIKATGVQKGKQDTWQFDDDCKVIVNGEEIEGQPVP